jgi:hypothetical protein
MHLGHARRLNASRSPLTPDVKVIKSRAFYQCTQLATMNHGEGLVDIGEEAFMGCRSLNEIIIPHAVTANQNRTFQ